MPVQKILSVFSAKSLTKIVAAAVIVGIALYIFTAIPSKAESKLESILSESGFPKADVKNISLRPDGFVARGIDLDEFGFDKISSLDAKVNWMGFLFTGNGIHDLSIKGMTVSRKSENISYGLGQITKNLQKIDHFRLGLSDVVIDISSAFGDIRLVLNATIYPAEAKNTHDIKATLQANQYQLGFESAWEGTLKKGGELDLAGNFSDGRFNLGPLRMSRFTGWLALELASGNYIIQNQFDAGSATFMDVPLQNISVVNDLNVKTGSSIVRAGISGMPDILFTMDYTRNIEDQSMTAALKGKNLGGFLDFIEEQTKKPKTISDALLELRDFKLLGQFQPEKRFVGGPLPFGITLYSEDNKILDGNILFYTDNFDVRGSLETTEDMAQAMQAYFKIPSENIKQNFIRLDGDAKRFLQLEQEPAAQK